MGMFYTGRGDQGSSQIAGKKIPKDSPIVEALGNLDELNSLIGVTRSELRDQELAEQLKQVQETLFIIQARCAWIMFPEQQEEKKLPKEKIEQIEQEIDKMEKEITPERGFVIPGEDATEAKLDYLRAVSRRAERSLYKLHKEHKLPQELLTYTNRLSSYFYALARYQIFRHKIKEDKPTYE